MSNQAADLLFVFLWYPYLNNWRGGHWNTILLLQKGPDVTTEPTESQATRSTTMDECSTKRQSLSSSDLTKTPEEKQTERREVTSVKTTKHTQGTQTSRDVEPHSSVFTDIPLKYILIASGFFVVMLFALLLLVYHLFKRRCVHNR